MSIKNEKIPVSLLSSYEKCSRLAYLKYNKEKNISSPKRTEIGTILHTAFNEFNNLWTDDMYNSGSSKIGLQRLKKNLDIAEKNTKDHIEKLPRYLENSNLIQQKFRRIFRGNNGYTSKILNTAQKISVNNEFEPIKLVTTFFKGEPQFEYTISDEDITGKPDVLIEKEDPQEFFVWELKTCNPPSTAWLPHLIQAATYGYLYEKQTNYKCVGLKILYLGEKEFDIAFTDDHRKLVKEKILQMKKELSIKESLPKGNKTQCKSCTYKDFCERQLVAKIEETNEGVSKTPSVNKDTQLTKDIADRAQKVKESEDQDNQLNKDLADIEQEVEETELTIESEEELDKNVERDELSIKDISENSLSANIVNASSSTIPETSDKIKDQEIDTEISIGLIIQNEKAPFVLSLDKINKLSGAIRNEFQQSIHAGQILIAESEEEEKPAAIVEIREISSFPKDISSIFMHINSFNIYVVLFPFLYYEKTKYTKILYPTDFSAHYLRLPSDDELIKIMHLHDQGIPLGLVTYELLDNALPKFVLPYCFPFSYKEVGYKGIFVVGSPGKGKTNILKILINGLSNYIQTPDGKPPAVIILDTTGQFNELNIPTKNSTTFDEEIWEILGMKIVENNKNYKIRYDHGPGDYTLTLNAIDPELITLLFPDLPPNSAQNFKRLVKNIFREYPSINFVDFVKKVILKLEKEGELINPMVKKAIINAIRNGPEEIFDQGGLPITIDEFIVPGKVSVVQVDHISDHLPILLYILMMISKRKIQENDLTPLVLILDEAHELFPKNVIDSQRIEYMHRISQNLIKIARIGRKKHFGLIFASQQPKDIIPEIIGVFQTKIILGLESTSIEWIRQETGKEYVNTILKLEQGYARINNTDLHKGTLVPVFIPIAPNKHEEE